jgi:hypothetical protein
MAKTKGTTVDKVALDNLVKNYALLDKQEKSIETARQALRKNIIHVFKNRGITSHSFDGATVSMVTAETVNFDNVAMQALLGRKFKDISIRVVDRDKFKANVALGKFEGIDFGKALNVSCVDKLIVSGEAKSKLSFTIE